MSSYDNLEAQLYSGMFGRGSYSNPFFTATNQFMPRNFKEALRWAEYITVQSPIISEVIRKHATYPITEFTYETNNEQLRKRYIEIIKQVKLKHFLCNVGYSYYTVGNVFISVYLPFNRMACCPNCKTTYNVKLAKNIVFRNFKFTGKCVNEKCSFEGVFPVKDTPVKTLEEINLITWDPYYIAANHNPISGESDYYYQIPPKVKKGIRNGDPLFVSTVPLAMIEAVEKNKSFKFDKRSMYHFKNLSIGRMDEGMALPPMIALFSLVFHQAMLRKANEAIAAEHMTPMRVLFPQQASGNSDPAVMMSLRGFANNIEAQVKMFKQDPNHLMVSPIPVGVGNVGGDGKNLLVAQEMQFTEESILMSLGVSRELLSGTTNWTSSDVGLRLLSNSMENYVRQIDEVTDWVMKRITGFLGIEYVDTNMVPFKLTDDDYFKQLMPELIKAGMVSKTTVMEAMGRDYKEELQRKIEEQTAEVQAEIKGQKEIEKAKHRVSIEVSTQSDDSAAGLADAKNKAFDIFMQLIGMDPVNQNLALVELEQQDKGVFELVADLLKKFQNPTATETTPEVEDQMEGKEQSINMTPVSSAVETGGQMGATPDAAPSKPAAKPAPKKSPDKKGPKK